MARAVRRVGLAEVPPGEPRPEPSPHAPRLRRHLLLAPLRPRHAARGDDGRARHRRPPGQGAVRGISSYGPEHTREAAGSSNGSGHRSSSTSPRTRCSTGGSRTACSSPRRARRRLHRLLPPRPGPPHRPVRRRHPGGLAIDAEPLAHAAQLNEQTARKSAAWPRSPRVGGSRSPRWRSPGRCAIHA